MKENVKVRSLLPLLFLVLLCPAALAQTQCGGTPVYGQAVAFVTSTPSGTCQQGGPIRMLCSDSTTKCTISGTTVSGDTIIFSAVAY